MRSWAMYWVGKRRRSQLAPREFGVGKTVIVAAVADNRHSLAARVFADFFEISGWRAISMGAGKAAGAVRCAAE